MSRNLLFVAVVTSVLLMSCSTSKKSFDPNRKYSAVALRQDYSLFRNILEKYHPSLYWFTPKDSIDYYFERGWQKLNDSLTENQFRYILQDVTTKIRCGHTSVRSSRKYIRYLDTALQKTFPLALKVWPDSMAVIANTHRRDSIFRRGTVVYRINGLTTKQITDTFFNYLVTDGHAINGKYQALSSGANFGTLYRNIFGLTDKFEIEYRDSLGQKRIASTNVFVPVRDTTRRTLPPPSNRDRGTAPSPPRINRVRSLQVDTTLSTAYMTLTTFARGNKLRSFFHKSFRVMKERSIKNLVIDVRSNGGGDAGLSTLLTRYLVDRKFKLADSLYAVRRSGPYNKYIKKHLLYRMGMFFVTKKKRDGYYHFTFFERHYYSPRKKNHFNGDVYIIIGGNSFSATTLFAKALQAQKNVTIVGEESGGGAYGNSAWMIPDVVLPNTKIRFRLPLFRLVMDKNLVREGRGIQPDIYVAPSAETIRLGIDPKSEAVRQLIVSKSKPSNKSGNTK